MDINCFVCAICGYIGRGEAVRDGAKNGIGQTLRASALYGAAMFLSKAKLRKVLTNIVKIQNNTGSVQSRFVAGSSFVFIVLRGGVGVGSTALTADLSSRSLIRHSCR